MAPHYISLTQFPFRLPVSLAYLSTHPAYPPANPLQTPRFAGGTILQSMAWSARRGSCRTTGIKNGFAPPSHAA
jgi:hypothetical protein